MDPCRGVAFHVQNKSSSLLRLGRGNAKVTHDLCRGDIIARKVFFSRTEFKMMRGSGATRYTYKGFQTRLPCSLIPPLVTLISTPSELIQSLPAANLSSYVHRWRTGCGASMVLLPLYQLCFHIHRWRIGCGASIAHTMRACLEKKT